MSSPYTGILTDRSANGTATIDADVLEHWEGDTIADSDEEVGSIVQPTTRLNSGTTHAISEGEEPDSDS